MKKFLTFTLLGILGVANHSYKKDDIPDRLKEYMYLMQHDSTVEYGFNFAKKHTFIDQNVQFQDWYIGLPFQFYDLNIEKVQIDSVARSPFIHKTAGGTPVIFDGVFVTIPAK